MTRQQSTRTELARLGFADLTRSRELLDEFDPAIVPAFALAADPDQALALLARLGDTAAPLLADPDAAARLIRLLGASSGLGDFFARHPEHLDALGEPLTRLPGADELRRDLLASVADVQGESAWGALRVRYRRHLARI